MWIPRDTEARLLKAAATRPVVVLTGARQTGKTSILRHLFPRYGLVSLDLPTEAEQAERAPEAFLRRHPAPLIVDEVQYAPGLFRHLKAVEDANRRRRDLPCAQRLSADPGFRGRASGRPRVTVLGRP